MTISSVKKEMLEHIIPQMEKERGLDRSAAIADMRYAYIKKAGNKFIGLFYVKDEKISFNKSTDPIYKNFDILVNEKRYKNYDFIKVLRNSKDGASGKGLTTEINKALETAFQRIKYEYELTATGGSRKGFT